MSPERFGSDVYGRRRGREVVEAMVWEQWTAGCRSELLEGPPHGGPSLSMDPRGRIRTGISAVDSCLLYRLSYPGVVPAVSLRVAMRHKTLLPTRRSGTCRRA